MPCSICRQPGHNRRTCPMAGGGSSGGSSSRNDGGYGGGASARRCGICREPGHNRRSCPENRRVAPPAPPVRRCGICHSSGHDRRSCPANRPVEPPAPRVTARRCGICREPGHDRSSCPLNRPEPAPETPTPNARRCGICRAPGHDRRSCPENRAVQPPAPRVTVRRCSICGQPGHTRRTCPANRTVQPPAPRETARSCDICREPGHDRSSCPLNRSEPASETPTPDVRRCGICREPGHNRSTCPLRDSEPAARGGAGSGSTPERRCGICRKPGHNRRTCPMSSTNLETPPRGELPTPSADTPTRTPAKVRRCGICRQAGHNRRTCPERETRQTCRACGEDGHSSASCPVTATESLSTAEHGSTVPFSMGSAGASREPEPAYLDIPDSFSASFGERGVGATDSEASITDVYKLLKQLVERGVSTTSDEAGSADADVTTGEAPAAAAGTTPAPKKSYKVTKELAELIDCESEIDFASIKFDEGDPLGAGAFGVVRAGEYNGDRVAIKTLHLDKISRKLQKDYANEVRTLRVVSQHPNIVTLVGQCSKPPNLALVMEYVDGGDLHDLLHESGDTEIGKAQVKKAVMSEICTAMAYLHKFKIMHRDLKPQNVLVNARYSARVADFGLAKLRTKTSTTVRTTATENAAGTPLYMPPETYPFSAYKPSFKADVYAFGIMLNEILSEAEPDDDLDLPPCAGIEALFIRVKEGFRPEVPEEADPRLIKLIQRCWHADAAERPTFDEISRELAECSFDVPFVAAEAGADAEAAAPTVAEGC